MRTAELLTTMAAWLESPDNEALLLAEEHEDCLRIVAESCVLAAQLLKNAAAEVDVLEPVEASKITPESVEEIAALARALDESGDDNLKKQASVLDELLLSIAAPPNAYAERKDLQEQRLIELQKKYQQPSKDLHKANMIDKSEKVLSKSKMMKPVEIHQEPLSARTCPDHAGAQLGRVGEHMWQCELDKKIYNYETGYSLNNGTKVPGGDVALQTQNTMSTPYHSMFDSREGRLQSNNI